MKLIKRLRLSWQLAITVLLAVAMLATPFLDTATAQTSGNTQTGMSSATVTNSVTDTSTVAQVVYYSSKQVLSDGGLRYTFLINGANNILNEAPDGFCPVKATDAQLQEYGFPARPKDASALASWTSKWSRWVEKRSSVEPYLVISPFRAAGTPQYTYNWSGYEDLNSSRNWYTMVAADFVQPYWNYNSPLDAEVCSWVGLGGNGTGDPLVQCGTLMGWYPSTPTTGHYAAGVCSAWYEYLPYDPTMINVLPFTIHSNDQLSMMTTWNPTYEIYGVHYPATFVVWDWTTMSNFNIVVPDPNNTGYDGGTAEVVDERPGLHGGGYTPLAGFGNDSWSYCKANNGDFVDNSTFSDTMTSNGKASGTLLAEPYAIQNVNGDAYFTDHYVASQ
jgi:hypothetical protein